MPRILIVAYYFPPWGMGGVQRVLKFAKYLPDFEWDVTVLAPRASSYHNQDPSLLNDLPESVQIERVDYTDRAISKSANALGAMRPLARWFSSWRDFPDRHRRFADLALSRAEELMRERPFDVVLTSSPPPSVHRVGIALSKHCPWIADFRDPWQALFDDYGPTLLHRLSNSGLHKQFLTKADRVIAVTPELRGFFEKECGASSVSVIPNGFDESDFSNQREVRELSDVFRVVLPGTLGRFSDPRPILRALAEYRKQSPQRQLRITHVGAPMDSDLALSVADFGLNDVFDTRGYLSHHEAIAAMLDSDLLMLAYTDRRVTDVSVPGRIYEMLRTHRPIIAITPSPGALANLLSPIDGCEVANTSDVATVVAAIDLAASSDIDLSRRREQIRPFERREQTRRLSDICHEAINTRRTK